MSQTNEKNNSVDISNAMENIWLVKVPNYVAQQWALAPDDMTVATLRMEKSSGNNDKEAAAANVKMILSPELLQLDPSKTIASHHELKLCKPTKGDKLSGIFSITDDSGDAEIQGWVSQKMECLPICNEQYLKMKQKAGEGKSVARSAKPLQNVVASYKPVKDHIHNEGDNRRRKEIASKILSKDAIMNLLFEAFEKHQYYSLKNLINITNQSVYLLKTILKDIGIYNRNPEHRFMWELKEEYRHYRKPTTKPNDINKATKPFNK